MQLPTAASCAPRRRTAGAKLSRSPLGLGSIGERQASAMPAAAANAAAARTESAILETFISALSGHHRRKLANHKAMREYHCVLEELTSTRLPARNDLPKPTYRQNHRRGERWRRRAASNIMASARERD